MRAVLARRTSRVGLRTDQEVRIRKRKTGSICQCAPSDCAGAVLQSPYSFETTLTVKFDSAVQTHAWWRRTFNLTYNGVKRTVWQGM